MNYFNWAALGTIAMTIWSYASGWLSRIRSFFIINVRLTGGAREAFLYLLWKEFKRSKWGDKHFIGDDQFVIPLNKNQKIGYEELPSQSILFWQGWKPILIGGMSYANSPDMTAGVATVNFFRGTFDIDQLLIKAFDLLNESQISNVDNRRFTVSKVYGFNTKDGRGVGTSYKTDRINEEASISKSASNKSDLKSKRILKWNYNDLGSPSFRDPLKSYSFPKEVLNLINEIKRWIDSATWFKDKQISWKLGVLLASKPGCGKSSLVKAIGQTFDLPIFSYDLSTLTNKEFDSSWNNMMVNTPCIALFEDIDVHYNGRENLNKDGVTFDCLLNAISGVGESDGVLTIITTNNLSKVDAALGIKDASGKSSRPGRINKIVQLGNMDEDCRRELANKILIDSPEKIEEMVRKTKGFTPAQTQEKFAAIALEHYWSKQ